MTMTSDVLGRTSDVRCPMSDVYGALALSGLRYESYERAGREVIHPRRLFSAASDIGHRTSDVFPATSDIGHRTSDVAQDLGHRTSDVFSDFGC